MFQQAKQATKKFLGDVQQYGDTVLNGRNDVPPKVRHIVKEFKDVPIVSIVINRTPVNSMIIKALNTVSQGHFSKKMDESPYDKLYHLRIDCKMQNGKTVKLEKNEVINADVNPSVAKDAETKPLNNMKQGITLKGLLQGGERVMGNKFIPYDAVHNNCQDFIMGILKGSNIGDQSDIDFIKQHTKDFFKGKDQKYVRQTAKFVTDLGGKVNEIMFGHGLEGQQIQSILFDRKLFTLPECKKWLKKHGYKSSVDTKPEHYRFRQVSPKLLTDYKTKEITDGIQLILGTPKIQGKGIKGNLKSLGKDLLHPQHTTHNTHQSASDAMTTEGKIIKDIFTGKITSIKDITHNKEANKLWDKYNKDDKSPNKLKGFKNKVRKISNMSESDTDHEGDYSSNDETMGSGLPEEGDIMHRMALLSHDIHQHQLDHGLKPRIVKGYQLLGHGIKESADKEIRGGKINRVKKFNRWFKAIGSKFKTLNHNLQPIKRAGEDYAVQKINPLSAAENYLNDFQREGPETMQALRGMFGSSKETKPSYGDSQPSYGGYQPDYGYSYNLPNVPVAQPYESPFADSYYTYANHMYGNGIQGKDLTPEQLAYHQQQKDARGGLTPNQYAMKQSAPAPRPQPPPPPPPPPPKDKKKKKDSWWSDAAKSTGHTLSDAGKIGYAGFAGTAEGMMFPMGNPYSTSGVGYGIGGNVKKTAKSSAKDLITAGSDRAVRAINGSNVIKTSKGAAKDLITAGSDRGVRAIEGSNVIKTSKGAAKDLITAGSDRGVRAIEGSGAKRGRLVKGSPEAKEWARKMREAKMRK